MVRWTITFTSRVDDESIGYQAIRKFVKAARFYGLRCRDVEREPIVVVVDRRAVLARAIKRELAEKVVAKLEEGKREEGLFG
jgi:hypothetical protein